MVHWEDKNLQALHTFIYDIDIDIDIDNHSICFTRKDIYIYIYMS